MDDSELCTCGHEFVAHAAYFGMACKFCGDCKGFDEYIECKCSSRDLWIQGCKCGAIQREK